jgi:hypothetical protein
MTWGDEFAEVRVNPFYCSWAQFWALRGGGFGA